MSHACSFFMGLYTMLNHGRPLYSVFCILLKPIPSSVKNRFSILGKTTIFQTVQKLSAIIELHAENEY